MKFKKQFLKNMSKKYGVLVAEAGVKWGGADGVGREIIKSFKKDENENWEYFKACEGELPDVKNLKDFAGFITSGSAKSANDDFDWLKKLEEFFRQMKTLQDNEVVSPKLVGLCFGHQIINKALGGKVSANESGKFILQQSDIQISEKLMSKDFYQNSLGKKSSFTIIQSHGEEVSELPKDAKSFAHSDTCRNEIVLFDNEKILTFQGHCEFRLKEAIERILPAIRRKDNFDENGEKFFWKTVEEKTNENEKCIALIRSFLGLENHSNMN